MYELGYKYIRYAIYVYLYTPKDVQTNISHTSHYLDVVANLIVQKTNYFDL